MELKVIPSSSPRYMFLRISSGSPATETVNVSKSPEIFSKGHLLERDVIRGEE